MKIYGSWGSYMKNRVILYSNDVTNRTIWFYGNRMFEAHNDDTYDMMTVTHELVRSQTDRQELKQLTEAIKFLLKTHGYPTK